MLAHSLRLVFLFHFILLFANRLLAMDVGVFIPSQAETSSHYALDELKTDFEQSSIFSLKENHQLKTQIYFGQVNNLRSPLRKMVRKADYDNFKQKSRSLHPESFIVLSVENIDGTHAYVIAGGGPRGLFYGAYHFANRFLGVQPAAYWLVPEMERTKIKIFPAVNYEYRESPPAVPLRGYFDNDSDMLANWYREDLGVKNRRLVIEAETWRDMIDSLSRLRYNFIDIHDTLGRTEFFAWDYYKNKFPGYRADPGLIKEVIDYAHKKSMLVQVPLYLGWEFLRKKSDAPWRPGHLRSDDLCYSKSAKRWHQVLNYMLDSEHSPVRDADIFLQRPRHAYLDHPYRACEGEEVGAVMTEWVNHLHRTIKKYNPDARLVIDLWHEGKQLWQSGRFRPNDSITMVWADSINGDLGSVPASLDGYKFGLYLHAGVWLNHVVQDPTPMKLAKAISLGTSNGMNEYLLVNGQDFKHFLLNLEASSRAAWNPDTFDSESFKHNWAERYFGKQLAGSALRSLDHLRGAHEAAADYGLDYGGYQLVTSKINGLLRGRAVHQLSGRSRMLKKAGAALNVANDALSSATSVSRKYRLVFDDQIRFPADIYYTNVRLLDSLVGLVRATNADSKSICQMRGEVISQAKLNWQLLARGSLWRKWHGWTSPLNFRVFTPPMPIAELVKNVNNLPVGRRIACQVAAR